MKEIMAIVRMKKTGATKRALIEAGVAGFTAVKAMGRGKLLPHEEINVPCKRNSWGWRYRRHRQGGVRRTGRRVPRR
jgi:nitrogen regulatory protein PII 2